MPTPNDAQVVVGAKGDAGHGGHFLLLEQPGTKLGGPQARRADVAPRSVKNQCPIIGHRSRFVTLTRRAGGAGIATCPAASRLEMTQTMAAPFNGAVVVAVVVA